MTNKVSFMPTPLRLLAPLLLAVSFSISHGRAQESVATSPETTTPLKVGLKLPAITLNDSTGAAYELTKSLANGPAILIVYRGGWCPYCNSQLSGMGKIEPDLLKLGYRLFAISPDTPAELSKTMDKHKLKYKLLSDTPMQAARALGLAYRVDAKTVATYKGYGIDLGKANNLLPVTAVYIVGSDGVVDFSYVNPNYQARVPDELVLAAAKIFAEPTAGPHQEAPRAK